MKQLAVIVAALLALVLVAPAMAQPFADVPTDHWAYDAIAELAAKGLIEGYPDGSFKGDRAMTRYEMAMVVARLLARIEAIKIPPLPPDLVRQAALNKTVAAQTAALTAVDKRLTAKLATIQRLVAEFRAELAALGVRVTAVEEELAAIRARLDNTKVTGDMRYRDNFYPSGSVSGSGTLRSPDARLRGRITFTGAVNPVTTAVIRIRADNMAGTTGATADTRFGNDFVWNNVSFDLMHLDIRNTLGARLWRVGRQYYSLGYVYPLNGALLFDPPNSAGCPAGAHGFAFGYNWACTPGTIDGLRSDWALGPLNLQVGLFRQSSLSSVPGLGVFSSGYFDFKTVRLTTGALLPGWTLGGVYYDQGVVGGAPGTWTGGKGWGLDVSGTLFPGLTLAAEWASWRTEYLPGPTFTSATANAWRVAANLDLARLAGITTWSPTLDVAYMNYGPMTAGMFAPFYTYASTSFGQYFAWNMRGWLARLNLTFSPRWSAFIHYEGGTELVGNTSYYEWWLRLTHVLTPRTNIYFQYTKANNAFFGNPAFGGDLHNFYRVELSTSW
ncbi:MAG: S-layer homology domain-containing protein [Armatimonadota bacterium]|nr:S-layer homology domain-containing protein [Armatimonadota bacterium]